MKSFDIPAFYRSPLISAVKQSRKAADKLKKDFTPTLLDFGLVKVYLARHFGFCYGVENAIEIAFRTVNENPGKRIFLLSEMIHNPQVNADLLSNGVQFIMNTRGDHYIEWDELTPEDLVIIPAFGTTLETEQILRERGIDPLLYNTTCPFVEKVWNRSAQIGQQGYTVIIHGKPNHEETRATFSHSRSVTPSVVIRDMQEAEKLALFMLQKLPASQFYIDFDGQYSPGFDVAKDFDNIGVVNQTTMLASDTQAIADYLKRIVTEKGSGRFADTRDTLCYATNDNQTAVQGMLETQADLALVVGGYNSSNTSHLVELCEEKLPSYFIENEQCMVSNALIRHFDYATHKESETFEYLPSKNPLSVLITSGASCPDATVERVIQRLLGFFPGSRSMEDVLREF